jgi:hypothetical protein
VVRLEGQPLFGGMRALPAIVQACGARRQVALGLKDGSMLEVPGRSAFQPGARMYAADIGKMMRALGIPDAPGKP